MECLDLPLKGVFLFDVVITDRDVDEVEGRTLLIRQLLVEYFEWTIRSLENLAVARLMPMLNLLLAETNATASN